MLNDEQLMMDFQAGRTRAFEELFERYRNPIYGFFRRRLNNPHRAEDLAQETFIVILRGTEKYEPKAKFRTWLYAVALKLLWSERRRELREARVRTEPVETQSHVESAGGEWIREA